MCRGNLFALTPVLALGIVVATVSATVPPANEPDIYPGWLDMYDLKFDEAHRAFAIWSEAHPADPLGPASEAAGYLFSELARLGALESELFVDDTRFQNRKTLTPDPEIKNRLMHSLAKADQLADSLLQKSASDADALFVKSLVCGLRADYAALVEKKSLTALGYTREGRPFNDKLLAIKPDAYDAYLGLGVENYLLSLKPAALRVILRLTGSRIDREKGLEQLRLTSEHGHYFEPFAKLLLAVAALRDNDTAGARQILTGLHERFPHNPLYEREIDRLQPEKR
jgi:hypothetical protein